MKLFIVYANWCPHCTSSMPVFEAVGARLGAVMIESADLDRYKYRGVRGRVAGFPTILMQDGRRWHAYEGPRTFGAIREWVLKKK